MSCMKELNNEELEKVSGGTPYLFPAPPSPASFAHQVGEQIYNKLYDETYGQHFWVRFNVVGLGAKNIKNIHNLYSCELFYKLETVDRTISKYDGWYDYETYKTINYENDIRLKKVSVAGMTIIA